LLLSFPNILTLSHFHPKTLRRIRLYWHYGKSSAN